ncbi:MAG: TlpA family protein disulfide reductase [Muribaculaceae bacterium]
MKIKTIIMRKSIIIASLTAAMLSVASCDKQPKLDMSFSDKFEGQSVELINFLDSTAIASVVVTDGKALIDSTGGEPVFTALLIDGRTRAFYVTEPGQAFVNDSTNSATGTPLNDRFAGLLSKLDSIENLDDMPAYLDFVRNAYNENKDNPLSSYFGIEWIKYADLAQVDSLLATAPEALKNSPKARHYRNFAQLRDNTSPGKQYIDFDGETADGKPAKLSTYVTPGKYTIVDFWASWCPYCIKEIPQLAALEEKWKDKGVEIVGVAVRDVPDDSKAAVKKHNITWPVVYNTQRRPYDIYGFSGIPHHMLIGPDGKIISRGETLSQIEQRLNNIAE